MPNRILKESICTSDSINELDWFSEVLWYRLIVNCDDYGRFDGRTAVIKNRLFPLKDNLTLKNVETAINKLASVGLVCRYIANGKPFLLLPTWNEHQQIRAKKSKYPAPDEICNQMISDDSNCPRNPIQSNTNPNTNPNTNTGACAEAFETFWSAYPKKVGKGDAKKAFAKVKVPVDVLVAAVETQKKSVEWTKEDGRYIPNPSTWLNQERWGDELTVKAGASLDAPVSIKILEDILDKI